MSNPDRIKLTVAVVLASVALVAIGSHFLDVSVRLRSSAAPAVDEDRAAAILAELKAIRGLLGDRPLGSAAAPTRRPRPEPTQNLTVSIEDSPMLGDPEAPVVLVEFTDFECPYCERHHRQTFPEIQRNFIDTGKVRYVVRDLPLSFHPNALTAARAARCAGEQGDYFAMWKTLFANRRNLGADRLPGFAAQAGLDGEALQQCLASERYRKEVEASAADANRLGITGTPSFVIGRVMDDGTVQGTKLVGAQPYAAFEGALNAIIPSTN